LVTSFFKWHYSLYSYRISLETITFWDVFIKNPHSVKITSKPSKYNLFSKLQNKKLYRKLHRSIKINHLILINKQIFYSIINRTSINKKGYQSCRFSVSPQNNQLYYCTELLVLKIDFFYPLSLYKWFKVCPPSGQSLLHINIILLPQKPYFISILRTYL